MNKIPTSGTPILLRNQFGRSDRYLLLAEDGNYAVARNGHGDYQGLRRDPRAVNGWTCVKVPTADYDRAWTWARS